MASWAQGPQWKWLQSNSCPKCGRTDKVTRCLSVRSHRCPAHSCLLSLSLALIRCSLSFCSLASLGGIADPVHLWTPGPGKWGCSGNVYRMDGDDCCWRGLKGSWKAVGVQVRLLQKIAPSFRKV